jgi:hypothetical protein
MAWTRWLCGGLLRLSRARTLSILVASALSSMRLSLAGIGRELAAAEDGSAKHAIKRVWRFTGNPRVEPVAATGIAPLIRLLLRPPASPDRNWG